MARYRSRRSNRRSASQSAANLLALALPAPVQRVADTRLGPLLMLVGVPSMLVAGLLQVNWSNGLPTVAVDPQAAANVIQSTRNEFNHIEQQGGLGHLASDIISGVSHASHQYDYGQGYPYTQQQPQSRVPSSNFPSTQPQSQLNHYTSTQPSTQASSPWGQQSTYPQQSTYNQQPTYAQQSHYNQQSTYAPQISHAQQSPYPQQPTYSQSGYHQQAASPSDNRNLTQQQLYQQQQYQLQQQQLYEQQQRDQQYRQWLAQQQHSSAQLPSNQPRSSTGYQQQYDSYGRPISTGYSQPSQGYSQPATLPTTQYGQQNYNQGYLPNVNPNGRY